MPWIRVVRLLQCCEHRVRCRSCRRCRCHVGGPAGPDAARPALSRPILSDERDLMAESESEEPIEIEVWPKGHYNPSPALLWKDEVHLLGAGRQDSVKWVVERHGGQDVLFVVSENPRLGYRGAERHFANEGETLEAEIYSSFDGGPSVGDRVVARKATDEAFFQGDSYGEVEDMDLEEFLDHASNYW